MYLHTYKHVQSWAYRFSLSTGNPSFCNLQWITGRPRESSNSGVGSPGSELDLVRPATEVGSRCFKHLSHFSLQNNQILNPNPLILLLTVKDILSYLRTIQSWGWWSTRCSSITLSNYYVTNLIEGRWSPQYTVVYTFSTINTFTLNTPGTQNHRYYMQ